MTRVDALSLKLLDDSIDEAELRALAELTQETEGRRVLLQMMELESHLQASGRSSIADRVLVQIQQERCMRVEEGVMRAVSESETSVRARPVVAGNRTTSRFALMFAGVAALAACILFVVVAVDRSENELSAIAQLNQHGSTVRILDADGKRRPVRSTDQPLALRPNETIETSHFSDAAEIVYPDGTKLELLGETRVRIAATTGGSKQITVLSGVVQADVARQPAGLPLRIVTKTATLEVLGTTLGVEVRDASTQLGVGTGRVAMIRKADGQRVEVEAGQFATATEATNEPLQSYPFPKLPSEWEEDFEVGLPAGWRTGDLIEFEDVKAVQAVRPAKSNNGHFVITSHNAWQEGAHALCRVKEGSVLHLRIRQRAFARITIMIGARSYPPAGGRIGSNLFYTRKAWNEALPADTWKTISVPLKDIAWQMKQGEKVNGPPDLTGLAAYLIHISTMEQDAGLTVDRMWITDDTESNPL